MALLASHMGVGMGWRRKLLLLLGAVAAIWRPTASALAAPPFNCSNAKEQSEIAICDSTDLGLLDREMNRLYFDKRDGLKAAGKLPEVEQLRTVQRGFLKTRDACGYDVSCLTVLYKKRVEELGTP